MKVEEMSMKGTKQLGKQTWLMIISCVAILGVVVSVALVTYSVAFAKEEPVEKQEVHRVFIEDQYITTVENEQLVEHIQILNEQQVASAYPNYTIEPINGIKVVTEEVAYELVNEDNAAQQLADALEVDVQAYAIRVDGETITHVKDEATAHEVKQRLYLQYVTWEQLQQARSGEVLTELANHQRYTTDVYFNETFEVVETTVKPSNVKGEDNAVQALLPHISVQAIFRDYTHVEVPYTHVVQEDASMFKGDTRVAQQGVNGVEGVTYTVREINGKRVGKSVIAKQTVRESQPHITLKGTRQNIGFGTGDFVWPAVGGYISSKMGERWGRQHQGIDIARPTNRDILASDGGVVTIATAHSTYGNYIKIDHQNGYETIYAHLSAFKVRVGEKVGRGQRIGTMGSTGRSTGMHLHFEVYKNGRVQNPLNYIQQ